MSHVPLKQRLRKHTWIFSSVPSAEGKGFHCMLEVQFISLVFSTSEITLGVGNHILFKFKV